jgi:glycerate-2-kinase
MADLKQLARRIFHETLAAINIPATMQRKVRRQGTRLVCDGTKIDLRDFERLRVVAIGKAAHAMVDGLELVLAPFVRLEGVVSAPTPPQKPVAGMKYFVAGHPVPNAESWKAAEAILALLKKCDEKTLVFFLLSGGGSALVELPLDLRRTDLRDQRSSQALIGREGRKVDDGSGARDQADSGDQRCAARLRIGHRFRAYAARFLTDLSRGAAHRGICTKKKISYRGAALDR